MNNLEQLKFDIRIYDLLVKLQDKFKVQLEHYNTYGFSEVDGMVRNLYTDGDRRVELLIDRSLTIAYISTGQWRSLYSVSDNKSDRRNPIPPSYIGQFSMNFYAPHNGGNLEHRLGDNPGSYEILHYDDLESGYFQYSTMYDPTVLHGLMLHSHFSKSYKVSSLMRKIDVPDVIDYEMVISKLQGQLDG